jgi:hypothetical protein
LGTNGRGGGKEKEVGEHDQSTLYICKKITMKSTKNHKGKGQERGIKKSDG